MLYCYTASSTTTTTIYCCYIYSYYIYSSVLFILLLPPLLLLPLLLLPHYYCIQLYCTCYITLCIIIYLQLKHVYLGGAVSDYMLFFALLPFNACYEYTARILYADIGEANKFFLILLAPLGILYCIGCLLMKFIYEPYAKLIVKSRISDGRLRVSYGQKRDNIENNSLTHFEDERLTKFLSAFIGRQYNTAENSSVGSGTETYKNIIGGPENDDFRGVETKSRDYSYADEGDDEVSKVTLNSSVTGMCAYSIVFSMMSVF